MGSTPALVLPVGEEWHAVALSSVREVLARPEITPVPASPPWLAGLVNVRGEILTAIDTGAAFGLADRPPSSHIAVVDTVKGPAAVLASGAPESGSLHDRCGEGDGPGAEGRYVLDERVATLLDLDGLIGAAP